MTEFLSEKWFDLLSEQAQSLPAVEGASADLRLTVTGGGTADSSARIVVEDGLIQSVEMEEGADAPLQLSCPRELAAQILRAEETVAVAFMRGTMKVNGDMGSMHRLLPLTAREPFRSLLERVAARTDL